MSIEITNILVDVWFQRLDTTVAEKRIESITEAYADARVKEALEQAEDAIVTLYESEELPYLPDITRAIRALIKEQKK